jgi:iron complex outermembrane receptor protein
MHKTKITALAAAAFIASLAHAQEGLPSDGAARPSVKLDRVEVQAKPQSDIDMRRKSQVAKQIYGREEIDKFGDTNVADVLKRLPGVSMSGNAPRMRGLGSGYTLVLINGDPAPPGFNLDQLDPAQVERIEVTKGPTADQSAQAVAGAINIILKDPPKQTQLDLRLGMQYNADHPTPSATFTYGEKKGGLSFSVPISAFQWRGKNESSTERFQPGVDGKASDVIQAQTSTVSGHGVNSVPRLNWKIDDTQSLMVMGFLQKGQWQFDNGYTNTIKEGQPILDAASTNYGTWQMLRGNLQYQNQFSPSQRIELKGSVQDAKGTFNNVTEAIPAYGTPGRSSTGNNEDRSYQQSGKFAQLLGDSHSLSAGWELEWRHRDEERKVTIDGGGAQIPGLDGLPFDARIQRQAYYAQDEWEISPQWSAYMGLRNERIETSTGAVAPNPPYIGDPAHRNVSSVTTPSLHVNFKPDPKGKDLIRASLTRSYKAPNLNDLLARPAISSQQPDLTQTNTQLSPDRIGNPDLKPELATGLDVAYEKYLSGGGMVSLGGFYRSVNNLIRNVTDLESVNYTNVQRWVSHPVNFSKAKTAGIEFEVKGRAGELMPDIFDPKLPLNLRASLNWYKSKVEALPGPNNRLDGQQPWSGTLGADYRLTSLPLNMGASFVFTPGYTTTQTDIQTLVQSRTRGLDAFAQWSFSRTTTLRFAVNNLFAVNTQSNTITSGQYYAFTERKGRPFFNIGFETKL